ncbi:MAG: deoxyribodipyrimidine photo-lyase [Synechococcaceae cyanobacterium SM2_3_60]|nr:deoxyribodipyrimidine photo-lyase [Synechococcaceae cyanobacterium SM2_3_60]
MQRLLLWFRRDLRLSDQAALYHAAQTKAEIVPVFIFDPYLLHHPEVGSGRVQFMLQCLESLERNLQVLGLPLIRRYGAQAEVIPELAAELKAEAVFWNEDSERQYRSATDQQICERLRALGIAVYTFSSEAGLPAGGRDTYDLKVFTPAWEAYHRRPLWHRPPALCAPTIAIANQPYRSLTDLHLPPCRQWHPVGGERYAHQQLQHFLSQSSAHYLRSLSRATAATSHCSHLGAYLKFGCLSVRQAVQAARQYPTFSKAQRRSLDAFVGRLFWRDHFYQKLRNLPHCETQSYLSAFDAVPWNRDWDDYIAWCDGQTGYPLVDAAMRCLKATGWLPFRLRALCATFLCIDLFMPWQWGALHYMQCLIDADVAIDHWQWQSHAGASNRARHWFRVYNPVSGCSKIDPEGDFIRRWLPELAAIPSEYLATPWRMSWSLQQRLGCWLGKTYPWPRIEHTQARRRALQILQPLKQTPAPSPQLELPLV